MIKAAKAGFNKTCGNKVKLVHMTLSHIHDVGDFIHVVFECLGTKVPTRLSTTYDLVPSAAEFSGAHAGRDACMLALERCGASRVSAVADMIRAPTG